MNKYKEIMDHLLYLYDFHIRIIDKTRDEYNCGSADAIGQCIIDIGKILGEAWDKPYKYEAYNRVMKFENVEQYKREFAKVKSQ